jgi:hypothetical protein
MTPSVAAASPTVALAAPFAVVSTVVHDREWWAEEAVRAGTDRSSLVAASMVEQTQPETITLGMRPGVRPPPNITAIGPAVSLSRSSRSDWNVCAGSWRTASRWSPFMTRSAATGRRRPSQSRPSSSPSESTARRHWPSPPTKNGLGAAMSCRWRIVGNAEDTFRSQERQLARQGMP